MTTSQTQTCANFFGIEHPGFQTVVGRLVRQSPSSITEDGDLRLNSEWTIWFHGTNTKHFPENFAQKFPDGTQKRWDLLSKKEQEKWSWAPESYVRIGDFGTVASFWRYMHALEGKIDHNGMWFVMRKGVMPIWEDPAHVQGGAWKIQVANTSFDQTWREISMMLIGEMMHRDTKFTGISASPKTTFSVVRMWTSDCETKLPDLKPFEGAIFDKHQK